MTVILSGLGIIGASMIIGALTFFRYGPELVTAIGRVALTPFVFTLRAAERLVGRFL